MRLFHLAVIGILLGLAGRALGADALREGFLNPPDAARPQTWWHWMNGNITREGITADLQAMKQIGLGGATIVNVDCGVPRGTVNFMSDQWRGDLKFAIAEAHRLGLHLCIENCAGWSSSGGPWNTPELAMQKLTCSETAVNGPVHFTQRLKKPLVKLNTYHDIAVLAFPIPSNDLPKAVAATEPDGAPAASRLEITHADYGDPDNGIKDVKATIQKLIDNGQTKLVVNNPNLGGDPAPGVVKRLRFEFKLDGKPGEVEVGEDDTLIFPLSRKLLAQSVLAMTNSVKKTFVDPPAAGDDFSNAPIAHEAVLDLTAKMTADGQLNWDAPAGRWVILRLGYTPIGMTNHPAPAEGTGLECDKLSKAALDAHWSGFMQKVLDDAGPLSESALGASLIDSYEVGNQDWTGDFRQQFQRLRGYDPLKFLPSFTRRTIDNHAVTERFLWDMRRTVADLFAENYYTHFNELCHQHGIGSAIEPYTGPFESLQCGKPADLVMGEFWGGTQGDPSVKLAASVAHIYGKTVVGAESFTMGGETGRWQNDPYSLKTLGDLMYCRGLNRYIFHRYAMQPWMNRLPGMTMGEFGVHFERTLTWWNQGKRWIDYITHCQYLLQQGRSIADIAYFTGESAPVEMPSLNPALPAGYDYDAVNSDVLLNGATVENGRIKLASGASYAVLVLPANDIEMTPAMVDGIRKLVEAGATVIGPRPDHSPSLADYPHCDELVKSTADQLWADCDGKKVLEHPLGKGRMIWGQPLPAVLASQSLKPDFEFADPTGKLKLAYVHRATPDAEIYFVSNQKQEFAEAACTFRVTGKTPELWHADTGTIEPAPIWHQQDGRTVVQLRFEPAGSVFVIFRPATGAGDPIVQADATVEASAQPQHLVKILHAVYRAVDGKAEMDVTPIVSQLQHDNEINSLVNNQTMGKDPAIDHPKQLAVDFTLDGEPRHIEVRENAKLVLPGIAPALIGPAWEVSRTPAGGPTVKFWADGKADLTLASGKVLHTAAAQVPAPREISGPWTVAFPPGLGAPPSVQLDQLISWTDHADAGVRYFSGTAVYRKDFEVRPDQLGPDRELWLDLGTVKNFAEISVNGKNLGVLWKPPFAVNITPVIQAGSNALQVKITNLWPNRLIGDEQLPADCEWNGDQLKAWPQWFLDGKPSPTGRITFTTWHHWKKDAELLQSGLIGPVRLKSCVLASPQ